MTVFGSAAAQWTSWSTAIFPSTVQQFSTYLAPYTAPMFTVPDALNAADFNADQIPAPAAPPVDKTDEPVTIKLPKLRPIRRIE